MSDDGVARLVVTIPRDTLELTDSLIRATGTEVTDDRRSVVVNDSIRCRGIISVISLKDPEAAAACLEYIRRAYVTTFGREAAVEAGLWLEGDDA